MINFYKNYGPAAGLIAAALFFNTSCGIKFNSISSTTANQLNSNLGGNTGAAAFFAIPQGLSNYNQLPTNYVQCMLVNGSTIYVGTDGGLAISTNGGATFSVKTTVNGLGSNNIARLAMSGSTLYVATGNGVSVSTDGGNTFTNTLLPGAISSTAVTAISVTGSNIYATLSTGLFLSTNGGSSFTQVNAIGSGITDLVAVGTSIYLANGSGYYKSTDSGNTFPTSFTAGGGIDKIVVNGTNVYALDVFFIYVSTDGGSTFPSHWTTSGSSGNGSLGFTFDGSGNIYAATNTGLAISTNGGTSFTMATTTQGLGSNLVNNVYYDSTSGRVYALTTDGMAWTLNQGTSFTNIANTTGLTTGQLQSVAVNGNTIYACGGGYLFGGFNVSTDGGQTWASRTMADGLGSIGCSSVAVSGNNVYVTGYNKAGMNGAISVSTTAGSANSFTSPLSGNFNSIATYGAFVYAADTVNGVAVSSNNGVSFGAYRTTANSSLLNNHVYAVYVDQTTGTLYAGTPTGVSVSTNNGTSFTTLGSSQPVEGSQGIAESGTLMFLATWGSDLEGSSNSGATFSSVSAPGVATDNYSVLYVPSITTLYYAAPFYGLDVSTNGGTSFTSYTNAAGLPDVNIYGMAYSGGKLYMATNGGLGVTH